MSLTSEIFRFGISMLPTALGGAPNLEKIKKKQRKNLGKAAMASQEMDKQLHGEKRFIRSDLPGTIQLEATLKQMREAGDAEQFQVERDLIATQKKYQYAKNEYILRQNKAEDVRNDHDLRKLINESDVPWHVIRANIDRHYNNCLKDRNLLGRDLKKASDRVNKIENGKTPPGTKELDRLIREAKAKEPEISDTQEPLKSLKAQKVQKDIELRSAKREENDLKQEYQLMRGMMLSVKPEAGMKDAIIKAREDFAEISKTKKQVREELKNAEIQATTVFWGKNELLDPAGNYKKLTETIADNQKKLADNTKNLVENKKQRTEKPLDDTLNKEHRRLNHAGITLSREYVALNRLKNANENHKEMQALMDARVSQPKEGEPHPPVHFNTVAIVKADMQNLRTAQHSREFSLKSIEKSNAKIMELDRKLEKVEERRSKKQAKGATPAELTKENYKSDKYNLQIEQAQRRIEDLKESHEFTNQLIKNSPKTSQGLYDLAVQTNTYVDLMTARTDAREKLNKAELVLNRAKNPDQGSWLNRKKDEYNRVNLSNPYAVVELEKRRVEDYKRDYDNINKIMRAATAPPHPQDKRTQLQRLEAANADIAAIQKAQVQRDKVRDNMDAQLYILQETNQRLASIQKTIIEKGPNDSNRADNLMDERNIIMTKHSKDRAFKEASQDYALYNTMINNSINPPNSPHNLEKNMEMLRQPSGFQRAIGNLGILDTRDKFRQDLSKKEAEFYKNAGGNKNSAAYTTYQTALSDYNSVQSLIAKSSMGAPANLSEVSQNLKDLQKMQAERDMVHKKYNEITAKLSDPDLSVMERQDLTRKQKGYEQLYQQQSALLERAQLPEGMKELKSQMASVKEFHQSYDKQRKNLKEKIKTMDRLTSGRFTDQILSIFDRTTPEAAVKQKEAASRVFARAERDMVDKIKMSDNFMAGNKNFKTKSEHKHNLEQTEIRSSGVNKIDKFHTDTDLVEKPKPRAFSMELRAAEAQAAEKAEGEISLTSAAGLQRARDRESTGAIKIEDEISLTSAAKVEEDNDKNVVMVDNPLFVPAANPKAEADMNRRPTIPIAVAGMHPENIDTSEAAAPPMLSAMMANDLNPAAAPPAVAATIVPGKPTVEPAAEPDIILTTPDPELPLKEGRWRRNLYEQIENGILTLPEPNTLTAKDPAALISYAAAIDANNLELRFPANRISLERLQNQFDRNPGSIDKFKKVKIGEDEYAIRNQQLVKVEPGVELPPQVDSKKPEPIAFAGMHSDAAYNKMDTSEAAAPPMLSAEMANDLNPAPSAAVTVESAKPVAQAIPAPAAVPEPEEAAGFDVAKPAAAKAEDQFQQLMQNSINSANTLKEAIKLAAATPIKGQGPEAPKAENVGITTAQPAAPITRPPIPKVDTTISVKTVKQESVVLPENPIYQSKLDPNQPLARRLSDVQEAAGFLVTGKDKINATSSNVPVVPGFNHEQTEARKDEQVQNAKITQERRTTVAAAAAIKTEPDASSTAVKLK